MMVGARNSGAAKTTARARYRCSVPFSHVTTPKPSALALDAQRPDAGLDHAWARLRDALGQASGDEPVAAGKHESRSEFGREEVQAMVGGRFVGRGAERTPAVVLDGLPTESGEWAGRPRIELALQSRVSQEALERHAVERFHQRGVGRRDRRIPVRIEHVLEERAISGRVHLGARHHAPVAEKAMARLAALAPQPAAIGREVFATFAQSQLLEQRKACPIARIGGAGIGIDDVGSADGVFQTLPRLALGHAARPRLALQQQHIAIPQPIRHRQPRNAPAHHDDVVTIRMDLGGARREGGLGIEQEPMRGLEVVAGEPRFVLQPGQNVAGAEQRRGAEDGKTGKEVASAEAGHGFEG